MNAIPYKYQNKPLQTTFEEKQSSTLNVPKNYLGVWKRTLLEQQGQKDTSSLVLWLQTAHLHADIRIPANRPDFSNCKTLEDCSTDQLFWLATQQGFFGETIVNQNICQWHRQFDFQPTTGARDIGEMVFDGENILLETGIDAPYFEVWQKLEGSHRNLNDFAVQGEDRHGLPTKASLLMAGNYFMYVRPRNVKLPNADSLTNLIEQQKLSQQQLLDYLDFEISFGELNSETTEINFPIQHSTLPFREGVRMQFEITL